MSIEDVKMLGGHAAIELRCQGFPFGQVTPTD